jgi:hypothetical protein
MSPGITGRACRGLHLVSGAGQSFSTLHHAPSDNIRLSNSCSTIEMTKSDGEVRPQWWRYPLSCSAGHPWAPGRIIVGWMPCDCPGAMREPGRGHLWVRCKTPGCAGIWYRPEHRPALTRAAC